MLLGTGQKGRLLDAFGVDKGKRVEKEGERMVCDLSKSFGCGEEGIEDRRGRQGKRWCAIWPNSKKKILQRVWSVCEKVTAVILSPP